MTYDTVSWEVTITRSLPDHGAIYGSRKGPISTRADFVDLPSGTTFLSASRRPLTAIFAC